MKQIGQTNNGNIILEAAQNEYKMLCGLREVTQNKALTFQSFSSDPTRNPLEVDFSAAFEAIYGWMMIKDRSQALRDMADMIERNMKSTEVK